MRPGAGAPKTFAEAKPVRLAARIRLIAGVNPQHMVDRTKTYVQLANRQYTDAVMDEHQQMLAAKREEHLREIEEEERRQKILGDLKI
jgi:hypothetical protein